MKLKRKQIERLVKWQQKLDHEEARLKTIERQLLGQNQPKLSSSRESQKETENDLNISIEKVRSIDRSLEILQNIPSHEDQPEEVVKVSGSKLNKLWKRLTGSSTPKFDSSEVLVFTKEKFSVLYEEARLFVLQNDFEKILDVSNLSIHNEKPLNEEKIIIVDKQQQEEVDNVVEGDDDDNEKSEVSTMNSIANIETEEEYPGSFQDEIVDTEVTSSTRKNDSSESGVLLEIPKLGNLTFEIAPKAQHLSQQQQPAQKIDDLNQSNLSVGISEMEVERDSHQTSSIVYSFEKIESSSVDIDGSIIPDGNNISSANIQITDMDESIEQEDQLIEDISFPDYENSISMMESENVRKNLSTITECTEYEQSQASSEMYTDYGTTTTSSTPSSSESKNVAIQNRLISINDSLTDVSEAFDRAVKPLSGLAKATNSAEATSSSTTTSPSKSSEENNTIQFSEHDILRHSTGGEEDDDKKSDSNGSSSDF